MDGVHRSRHPEIPCALGITAAILLTLSFHADLQPKSIAPAMKIQQQAKISTTTDLVVLPVNVTDANGAFVSGLRKEDFRVYEEGRLRNISLFAEEDTPVTVGLLVDHSQSMRAKLSAVITAVSTFAHSSNPEDEMFVVDFSDNVSVETLDGKTFTSDAGILEKAVSAVTARGQTALYDAVATGLQHLGLGKLEKKALIVVSDGGDNASRHKFRDVLNLARQAHAVIYSIGLVGSSEEEENPRALERLCRDTGGIAFFPSARQDISDIAKKIARDLREQYTLGYIPEKKARGNSFRKIAVKVDAPGRGKIRVRTRTGYLAPAGNVSATLPG